MRSKTPLLLSLLLLLTLLAPASAGLFGPTTEVFKGRVNFLQQTNFTVLTDSNKLVRILVQSGQKVPAEVQLGVKVEVKAIHGPDGLWYLDKFEKVHLQPTP